MVIVIGSDCYSHCISWLLQLLHLMAVTSCHAYMYIYIYMYMYICIHMYVYIYVEYVYVYVDISTCIYVNMYTYTIYIYIYIHIYIGCYILSCLHVLFCTTPSFFSKIIEILISNTCVVRVGQVICIFIYINLYIWIFMYSCIHIYFRVGQVIRCLILKKTEPKCI
jgi:hypothetical protein